MTQVNPRKYKVLSWIEQSSLNYHNSRTYGRCKFCRRMIRASIWQKHEQKCDVMKEKDPVSQKNLTVNREQKICDYDLLSSEIIKGINNTISMLIPKYLRQVYPSGITYQILCCIIGRIYSSSRKFIEELCCQFGSNITLDQIQAVVPANYHLNIACVVDNVNDLQNFMLLRQRIQQLKISESTKLKYKKALNLISKRYNLGWSFSYTESKEFNQTLLTTIKKKSLYVQKQQMTVQKNFEQEEIIDESEEILNQKPQLNKKIQKIEPNQHEKDEEQNIEEQINEQNVKEMMKISDNKCQSLLNIIQEMEQLNKDSQEFQKQSLSFKKKIRYIDFNKLQNYIKKCQYCKCWIKNKRFYKCLRCCSCFCLQCYQINSEICICSSDNEIFLPKICENPTKMFNPEKFLIKSKLNIYQSESRMSRQQIEIFQKSISVILKKKYALNFTRTTIFYEFSNLNFFNPLYDPSIQMANRNIQKIYEQYAKGEYLPNIKIAKSLKGYGIYAKQLITRNSFLFEYSGDILPSFLSRGRGDKTMKLLNGPTSSQEQQITPYRNCGVGPLLNYSSRPNAQTIKILVDGTPRVLFYSIKDIQQGQEICYDYNGMTNQYPVDHFQSDPSQFELEVQSVSQMEAEHVENFSKLEKYLQKISDKPYFICSYDSNFFLKNLEKKMVNIASIVKLLNIITCFYHFQQFDVDQQTIVKVPSYLKLFLNQTKAGITKRQCLSIGQLFKCMLICSGGDAAETLALYFSKLINNKSENSQPFLQKMKKMADILGLKRTIFEDCRGAKDSFSTVEDMSTLLLKVYADKRIKKYLCLQTTRIFTSVDGLTNRLVLTPTNQLIKMQIYGKTGVGRNGESSFIGFKQFENRTILVGIFDSREAQRWIIIKNIFSLCQQQGLNK